MSMLLRLALFAASAYVGASLGYEKGRKDAIMENKGYCKRTPSIYEVAQNLAGKSAKAIKQAANDIVNSAEYDSFKQKFSHDELRRLLCNSQVFDTVVDILNKNNGEYRPGNYFKGEEWAKYNDTPSKGNNEFPQPPSVMYCNNDVIGANVNISKNPK